MCNNNFDWSVTVDINPIKQPKPRINEGGDCGACCIAGIIGYTAEQLPEMYKHILNPYLGGKSRDIGAVNWSDLTKRASYFMHYDLKATEPVVLDKINVTEIESKVILHDPFYTTPWHLLRPWIHRLRTYLEAGYIAMTTIQFEGNIDPLDFKGTNHWVIVNGAKKITSPKRVNHEAVRLDEEYFVRIGCSVKGEYWVSAMKFLKHYGGFNLGYIRRLPIVKSEIKIDAS